MAETKRNTPNGNEVVREYVPLAVIKDISKEELEKGDVATVLLLNMSTLSVKNEGSLPKSKYNFKDRIWIEGYGQLEPVPQILNNYVLKEEGRKLDLVIITASDQAAGKAVGKKDTGEKKFCLEEDPSKGIKTNAVDFFKYRIRKLCGEHVQFYTVDIQNVNHALYETTDVIRRIKKKNPNQFQLYVDIHGGIRDVQLLFDAIISALGMEDIRVKEAYSCEYYREEPSEIKVVTDQLQVFQFVAGINEFIRYGYGRELQRYIKSCSSGTYAGSTWRSALADNIQEISDALALCKTGEFEEKLKQLNDIINKPDLDDDLFQIFIDNIKNDYGNLLETKKSQKEGQEDSQSVGGKLYNEVNWALNKGFYQQCLAIVEANTPKYVFGELFTTQPVRITQRSGSADKIPEQQLKKEQSWEHAENFYLKTMFYKKQEQDFKCAGQNIGKSNDNNIVHVQYEGKSGNKFDIYYEKKIDFGWNRFLDFGRWWWKLKEERNTMFHLNEEKVPRPEELAADIRKYLSAFDKLRKTHRVKKENIQKKK